MDPLSYYAGHGPITDPGRHASLLDGLPSGIPDLCRVLQGVLLHVFWHETYGVTLTEEREGEVGIRTVEAMLDRLVELDDDPLTTPRDPERKLVSNCRDFAVLLTAALRHQRVPARARSGFAVYFKEGLAMDHWVCEYRDGPRWVLVDAQLDEVQLKTTGATFDPCDVPRDQFLVAGKAWLACRAGEDDPDRFGIFDLKGMGFIRGNVGHDLWALNRLETLPWDGWGTAWVETPSDDDLAAIDHAARLARSGDVAFDEIRSLFENDPRFSPPPDWPPADD